MATGQAPTFMVIGKPIPRVEGVGKVNGAAAYTADVAPPMTVWAKNVRSPFPHARILSIDASRALAVPGVLAVVTAADIPNDRTGRNIKDVPLLCDDKVRFVGDKVAAVAAESREVAAAAAELVDVRYEELPAVFDAEEAMQPGAPVDSRRDGKLHRIPGGSVRHTQPVRLRHFGDRQPGRRLPRR